jgi:hypothetical protein
MILESRVRTLEEIILGIRDAFAKTAFSKCSIGEGDNVREIAKIEVVLDVLFDEAAKGSVPHAKLILDFSKLVSTAQTKINATDEAMQSLPEWQHEYNEVLATAEVIDTSTMYHIEAPKQTA